MGRRFTEVNFKVLKSSFMFTRTIFFDIETLPQRVCPFLRLHGANYLSQKNVTESLSNKLWQ